MHFFIELIVTICMDERVSHDILVVISFYFAFTLFDALQKVMNKSL